MQDIEVINRFKQQISWGDKTQLIVDGDQTYMATDKCLYVPTHFDKVRTGELIMLAAIYKKAVFALIWGDPSEEKALLLCDRLIRVKLHAAFIDLIGQMAWADYVTRALDGIDWQRSLEAIAKDEDKARPVFEWED